MSIVALRRCGELFFDTMFIFKFLPFGKVTRWSCGSSKRSDEQRERRTTSTSVVARNCLEDASFPLVDDAEFGGSRDLRVQLCFLR